MSYRFQGRALLAGLTLLAVLLFLPEVARADDDEDEWLAAFNEGDALRLKGDYPAAVKAYEWALERAPQVFGPEHQNTVAVLNNLGMVYWEMGQYAKAEPLYLRSLKIRESTLGPDHLDVAHSLNNLANLYKDAAQYSKAEPLYLRSLKIKESSLGPDHVDVATGLNNLANLYEAMAQYSKAEPLYLRSLKIRGSKLGPDHLEVADSLNNLASLYWATAQYSKAEPLYRRSLVIRESRLGPDHLSVAESLCNLANVCTGLGQHAQAESLYKRGLKIRESKLGPDHPLVATNLNNLAKLYQYVGQYAQAEPLYQRSLQIWVSKLGSDHPDVAFSLNNLAMLYMDMGQYAKAESAFQLGLKIRESKLGPDHPLVADSLIGLANTYRMTRQYAKAEPLYQRGIKIKEAQFGPDHPHVAWGLRNLANMYYHMAEYAKAETLYLRSLKICESKLGPDPAPTLIGLGVLYTDMRQFAKAEPLLQRGIKIFESEYGPDYPNLVPSLNGLLSLYGLTDRWSDAVVATEKQRRIVRRHVARTLPALSEKEQLTFLRTRDEPYLHNALSLGLYLRADAQSVHRSAGWVLNGKAVAQETLAQRTLLAAEGTDPALAEVVKQLLAVRSQLATLGLTIAKPGQEAEHRRQLQALNQQEQELSRLLGQATGRNTGDDPWVELPAVRKVLAKDAVLIEVACFRVANFKAVEAENPWLPPRYVAWLIPAEGQGKISIVDLGEAEKIDAAVQAARTALEKANTSIREEGEAKAEKQFRDAMRALTRMVLEPLEAHLGQARELVVSPDAALWLVPWGALPLADGKYAVEKYQIRYCISGRDLVSRAAKTTQKATDPVLFANPDYDLGPGEAEARTRAVLRSTGPVEHLAGSRAPGSLSSLPRVRRLPGTAEEAAAIKPSVARYAKAESVLYEDQYALEGVFKALRQPRVLVLCTHGFFLPDQEVAHKEDRTRVPADQSAKSRAGSTTESRPLENPLLRCGLLLAGCNRPVEDGAEASGDDGILTGLEIVGTDLRGTELVVLSACETGLGQVRNGEGVAGLRQAFQLAGANAVVSTLWKIPDAETVDVMNVFFAYLSQGQSKAEALRNAQLALIKARRADHSAAHPFYWAAFTLTGE